MYRTTLWMSIWTEHPEWVLNLLELLMSNSGVMSLIGNNPMTLQQVLYVQQNFPLLD